MEEILDIISVKSSEIYEDATTADLAGIYREVAETVGMDNAYKLFNRFRGLQLMFPLKFYSSKYIANQIVSEYDGKNIQRLARKYDYSESRVRQILRKEKLEKGTKR